MKNVTIVLILTACMFLSCSLDNGINYGYNNNNTDIGPLKALKQNGLNTLYLSSISIKNETTARNIRSISTGNTINTILYMNESKNIVPITFVSSNNKEVVLNIEKVIQIDSRRIYIRYSSIYEIQIEQDELIYTAMHSAAGQILIDIETKKLYDFSNFNLENTGFAVDGDTLYVNDRNEYTTLYKISMNNMTNAIPLNNPNYFPSGEIYFNLGDKIITQAGNYGSSFDINRLIPPKYLSELVITVDNPTWSYSGNSRNITIAINGSGGRIPIEKYFFIDNNNDLWFYCFFALIGMQWVGCPMNAYFLCKLSIDDNGQLSFSDLIDNTLDFNLGDDHQIYSIKKNGKKIDIIQSNGRSIILSIHPSGTGIAMNTINRFVSLENIKRYYDFNTNELDQTAFYYAINGMYIEKRMMFTDESPQIIYTIPDTNVENIWLTNERIYWWKWLNALTGATYSVPLNNLTAEPELITSSTPEPIEIEEIFYFNF